MTAGSFLQPGQHIDHTPGSAVVAGQLVIVGTIAGIAPRDIPANTLGQLTVCGVHRIRKTTLEIGAGVDVYWDADGNPVVGTAGSGAAVAASSGNTLIGKSVALAAAGTANVDVLLNNNSM